MHLTCCDLHQAVGSLRERRGRLERSEGNLQAWQYLSALSAVAGVLGMLITGFEHLRGEPRDGVLFLMSLLAILGGASMFGLFSVLLRDIAKEAGGIRHELKDLDLRINFAHRHSHKLMLRRAADFRDPSPSAGADWDDDDDLDFDDDADEEEEEADAPEPVPVTDPETLAKIDKIEQDALARIRARHATPEKPS